MYATKLLSTRDKVLSEQYIVQLAQNEQNKTVLPPETKTKIYQKIQQGKLADITRRDSKCRPAPTKIASSMIRVFDVSAG